MSLSRELEVYQKYEIHCKADLLYFVTFRTDKKLPRTDTLNKTAAVHLGESQKYIVCLTMQ